MTAQDPNPADTPPKTQGPASVTDCDLRLSAIKLKTLMLVRASGDPLASEGKPPPAYVEPTGRLASKTDSAFTAEVDWSLFVDTGSSSLPLILKGTHEVEFSVGAGVSAATVQYYAEINSVILAFPYIRQVVDDLCLKTFGRGYLIRPLDVPAFINKLRAARQKTAEQPQGKPENAEDHARQ